MSRLELKNMSFKAGQDLKIKGVPKSDAAGFSINVGHSDDHVALHFNPRFNCHGDECTIVCNSLHEGSWNEEQRESHFPFQQGRSLRCPCPSTTMSFESNYLATT
ncbi:hypothetical protein AAFF_G00295600 [Aldrovandia affinis]|uniref:Galectin n=1 Tax=Aldrovandia affinis TaxID=143900 RepID=A0AAD7SPR0_9TELE|nr:hypothetical protein AAFF_G00295600 [Aldrovandia affinis]